MATFEQRPVSALHGEPLDPRRVGVGLGLTVLIHATPPLYMAVSALLIAIGTDKWTTSAAKRRRATKLSAPLPAAAAAPAASPSGN